MDGPNGDMARQTEKRDVGEEYASTIHYFLSIPRNFLPNAVLTIGHCQQG